MVLSILVICFAAVAILLVVFKRLQNKADTKRRRKRGNRR